MAAYVTVGNIQTATMTNAAGQFFGQNVQTGWDSHSALMMGAGFSMGDWCWLMTSSTTFVSKSISSMPIFDQDQKSIYSPILQV